MIDDREFALNRQKLKDVVHYICSRCSESELGNVKLHKILYFADMLHFLSMGKPLTGVEYQKQKFGPVARHLSWAAKELSKEGRLQISKRDYFGYEKTDYKSLTTHSADLSNHEIHLLNDVIEYVCAKSAKEISELSHLDPWDAAEMGEIIPYCSAFGLLPKEIKPADIDRSIDLARRIRPEIEREFHGSRFF